MKRTIVSALALFLTLVISGAAQQVRDGGLAARAGTGIISGTVVSDDQSGRVIRTAIVTVRSADEARQYQTATDGNGRFSVTSLPAGRYGVSVAKLGYLSTSYGARTWSAPGVPIVLADGQSMNISVKLLKGATISGTMTNCAGYSTGGGQISAMRVQTINGERRFVAVGVSTGYDERGAYRIWGLPPGEYIVQGGATFINPIDLLKVTDAELNWARGMVQQRGVADAPGAPKSASITYTPCYYPGTLDESQAQLVKVGPGEDKANVDFPGDIARAAAIQGVMRDPEGNAPGAIQAALIQPKSMMTAPPMVIVRPEADGKFAVTRVPPGDYVLVVRAARVGETTPAPQGAPFLFQPNMPLWGTVNVSVHGQDINGIDVRLQPGVTVSGRVAFDSKAATPPPDVTQMRVSLIPTGGNLSTALTAAPATVKPDGTFSITGVPPNSFRLSVQIPPASANAWALKSATMNGRDSEDLPVEIDAGENVTDALITFTDTPTELRGRLVDSAGQPVQGYVLLAFSTDSKFWLSNSRRVKLVRSANDGTYKFTGLPPGDYFLCAAADIGTAQIDDATMLEMLSGASMRITLGETERKQLDFKLGG